APFDAMMPPPSASWASPAHIPASRPTVGPDVSAMQTTAIKPRSSGVVPSTRAPPSCPWANTAATTASAVMRTFIAADPAKEGAAGGSGAQEPARGAAARAGGVRAVRGARREKGGGGGASGGEGPGGGPPAAAGVFAAGRAAPAAGGEGL